MNKTISELFNFQKLKPSVQQISVSLPWHAAQRLRELSGSSTLRAIGILAVQLEGDSVITYKVGGQDIKVKGKYIMLVCNSFVNCNCHL